MRTDTPALLESLDAISTLFSDHNAGGRAAAGGPSNGGTGGGGGEEARGGGGGGQEYSTLDARRSLREDLERQVCTQRRYRTLIMSQQQ